MKGQFMLISAVVVGIIIIGTASTVNRIESQSFETEDTAKQIDIVKQEVSKVDMSRPQERYRFRQMVSEIDSYRTETVFWTQQNCFNITMVNPDSTLRLDCIS